MTRVLFLNRSYYPDSEATGQLLTELCEDLAGDFEVSVLCGRPNQNPLGLPYRRFGSEWLRSVQVRRVWHTRFSKATLIGRAINMVTFFLASVWSSTFGPRPDIVVVETDPPLLCLLGRWLKFRFRCRLIAYLQDIYPDIAIELGKLRDGWMTRQLRKAFAAAYRSADRVVVLSHDMANRIERFGISPDRISIIPNWTDCSLITPSESDNSFLKRFNLGDKFVVMYAGNFGLCQQLDTVIFAADKLRQRDDIVFVLVGGGASRDRLEQLVRDGGLKNVLIMDYIPKSHLSHCLSAATVHLIPLDPRVASCLMPSKLYGVLASGSPSIAIAPSECELSRIVREERIGFVVEPENAQHLASLLQKLADNRQELAGMGARARALAEDRYDRPGVVGQFRELLRSIGPSTAATSKSVVAETITANRIES